MNRKIAATAATAIVAALALTGCGTAVAAEPIKPIDTSASSSALKLGR